MNTSMSKALAAPVGVALSLLIAGQAMALSWGTPRTLAAATSSTSFGAEALATFSGGSAVAAYSRRTEAPTSRVLVRRTVDSGQTWSGAVRLSRKAYWAEEPVLATYGSAVDAVWRESKLSDPYNIQVRYRRSINGGATWGSSIGISTLGLTSNAAHVARGPNGRVAVVWGDQDYTDDIYIRVSTDGGATFGPAVTVFTSRQFNELKVAVGDGVIYVAYMFGSRVSFKRSFDDGVTWSVGTALTHSARIGSDLELTAASSSAYASWVRKNSSGWAVMYRRTSDSGASWAPAVPVTPTTGRGIWTMVMSLDAGVLRFAFNQCVTKACTERGLYYRQGIDGGAWTTIERLPVGEAYPGGVGVVGKTIVFYGSEGTIRVITGSP